MKPPKSYEEQLQILENRHLIIENREKALKILSNVNYYNLTGYLFWFKNSEGNYLRNVTFNQAVALYSFDKELHSLLLFLLTEIEQTLKTKIANSVALAYPENPYIYEEVTFFINAAEHQKFIKEFRKMSARIKVLNLSNIIWNVTKVNFRFGLLLSCLQ